MVVDITSATMTTASPSALAALVRDQQEVMRSLRQYIDALRDIKATPQVQEHVQIALEHSFGEVGTEQHWQIRAVLVMKQHMQKLLNIMNAIDDMEVCSLQVIASLHH